jgi:hypothetical protein
MVRLLHMRACRQATATCDGVFGFIPPSMRAFLGVIGFVFARSF